MDPVEELMNGVNPEVQERRAKTIAEMQRRSNDRIRIYNPTENDFDVLWDVTGAGGKWTVPARTKNTGFGNGQLVVPRYVAANYVKHMTDKIIGERGIVALRKINKEREEKGMRALDKWQGTPESQELVLNQYKTDNIDERRKIANILWIGVEEEYAANQPTQTTTQSYDARGIDEKIMDSMNRIAKPMTDFPTLDVLDQKMSVEAPVVDFKTPESDQGIHNTSMITSNEQNAVNLEHKEDLSKMNFLQLKKLAREQGIPVDLKTKKDELLSKMTQI